MKIIQLLAAIDGESPGTIGSQIYGLGDDGAVYELVSPCQPKARTCNSAGHPGAIASEQVIKDSFRYGTKILYYPGATAGWKEVCKSDERSEVIKHPLAQ